MNELALFAGAGGGILGGHLLGWRTVCAVELEPYAASVLMQRQNDGILQPFPIWDDVHTFDGEPWRGIVDVVSGGFPCQDISAAGGGAGITGERSGLWKEMARIIGEVRPKYAFVENSPMLTTRGLGTILGDLAALGFNAEWGMLSAADVGAPHTRNRIWIVASDPTKIGWDEVSKIQKSISPKGHVWVACKFNSLCDDCKVWTDTECGLAILGDGVAEWMGQSEALGNGQVPIVAATAWNILINRINGDKNGK